MSSKRSDAPAAELHGPAAVVRDLLRQHPEAWLGVPRCAFVALPWETPANSQLRAFRPAAGAATGHELNLTGRHILCAARINSRAGGLVIEILALDTHGRLVERAVDGWGRSQPGPDDLDAAMTAADAALAALWVTL